MNAICLNTILTVTEKKGELFTACSFRWFIVAVSTIRWFVVRGKHCWMTADSAE
jgi:hypothetical protein